jgi:hypothetical protein
LTSDPHAADPHADPHAAHAHGHAQEEAAARTEVPPFERTPWGLIGLGVLVAVGVVLVGVVRNWSSAVTHNPARRLPPPGVSVK